MPDTLPAASRDGPVLALQVAGIAMVMGGLWLATGRAGLLTGFTIGLLLIVLSPLPVFVVGHLGLLAVLPRGLPAVEMLLLIEAGLGTVLVTSSISRPGRILAFTAIWIALSGIALLGRRWTADPWAGGAILVGAIGLAGFLLHRYERAELQIASERA